MPPHDHATPVDAYLAQLPPEAAEELRRDKGLTEGLGAALDIAQDAWPRLQIASAQFVGYLADRCEFHRTEPGKAADTLGAMHVADLYLAFGCCLGDDSALEEFKQTYTGVLDKALVRLGVTGDTADEVKQRLYHLLLVRQEGREPTLAKYSGRGRLAGWLRVSVTRLALRQLQQHRREVAAGDDLLAVLPVSEDDPELAYLKDLYRGEFKTSLEGSMASLTARQRNLLRHQLVDHLSIDEIGSLYQVHRATAARWLEAARLAVVTEIKRGMMTSLRIPAGEYDSIMRLIQSGVDLSISRHLGDRSEQEPEDD